jgi:hypothetical protein
MVDGLSKTSCTGSYYLLTLTCTGTEDEIKLIESYSEDDSPGFESRPYNDEAILMIQDGSGDFWTPDRDVTTFEIIGQKEDGEANACSIMGCVDAYDVAAYLRGPDPLGPSRIANRSGMIGMIGTSKMTAVDPIGAIMETIPLLDDLRALGSSLQVDPMPKMNLT